MSEGFKVGDKQGYISTPEEVKWVSSNMQGRWWAVSSLRRNGWSNEKVNALYSLSSVLKFRDTNKNSHFSIEGVYVFLPTMDADFEETMKVLAFIERHRNPEATPYEESDE